MQFDNPHVTPLTPRMGNRFTRWIGDCILKAIGWRLEGQLPDLRKVIIIGGPHTSNWDFVLAMGCMLSVGLRFSWIMKKEAFIWPFGRLWRAMGGIPVDRQAKLDVVGQMQAWFDAHDTVWLGLTPEGTRSKVERYKTGYLRIAKGLGVPLFIVGIDGVGKRAVLDRIWHPDGEIAVENAAIQTYIEANYQGVRPQ